MRRLRGCARINGHTAASEENNVTRKEYSNDKREVDSDHEQRGLSEEDMWRWHGEFERSAPEEHQTFLEYLHIQAEEIRAIRERSLR